MGARVRPLTVRPAQLLKVDLGRVSYAAGFAAQQRIAEARRLDLVSDALILCEHDPVVTCGRRTKPSEIEGTACPVEWIDRGGGATFHGPGQIVGYPILKLAGIGTVGTYLRALESILIDVLDGFGLAAKRGDQTGVWVGGKKLVSIGIAVRRGVTRHGFALNVNTDLAVFRRIRPCGLDPQLISSMAEILGRPQSLREVKGAVWERFSAWHRGGSGPDGP